MLAFVVAEHTIHAMSDTHDTGVKIDLCAETKPEKINVRLFDLVRYMRTDLHAAELISDEEYSWLCYGSSLAKGDGSPSPRRLEDYDKLRHCQKQYDELIYAVATKHHDETRHETALRYINERESRIEGPNSEPTTVVDRPPL